MRAVAVGQFAVDFVADDQNPRFADDLRDFLQVGFLHDAAGGVVRVGENQTLCARRDGSAEGFGSQAELGVRRRLHADWRAARENHRRAVRNIARLRHKYLVARPNQCAQGNINRLRRADCHHDFGLGVVVGVEALGEVLADFPAQFRQTAVARVLRAAVDDGVDGGVADVIRGDEIGFAHAKGDGVLHRCGNIEETADAAGRNGSDGLVDIAGVIHGETTSLLSDWLPSKMTPSSL